MPVRSSFLAALGTAVIIAAIVLLTGSNTHGGAESANPQAQARFTRAEIALSDLKLPAEIRPEPSKQCAAEGASLCGRTSRDPPEMYTLLRRIVPDNHVFLGEPTARCTSRTPLCPVTVVGRFDGFRMFAIAFWHLIPAGTTPPHGAVRFARHGHRAGLSFAGSDISISLAPPTRP